MTKAKAAMGGNAWNSVIHLERRGRLKTGGLTGTLHEWESLLDGRSTSQYDLGVTKGAQGFDGKCQWFQDATGDLRTEPAEAPGNQAYMTSRAYWFPERGQGQIAYKELYEGRYHVITLKPDGLDAIELWIDGRNWLPDRVVTNPGPASETTFFQDYRNVSGMMMPFRLYTPKPDPGQETVIEYTSISVNPKLAKGVFSRPVPNLLDSGVEGGGTSTSVPLEYLADHLLIMATLNGKGPFRFFLDTGGVNVLSPGTLKALGLHAAGAVEGTGAGEKAESFGLTHVSRVQVGAAWMKDQSFYVVPSLENINKVMGVEVAGILGYELLRRFVARINYLPGRLTLTIPTGWTYQGPGVGVPFTFNGHHPRVKGELDGIPGLFDIDTGSGATLDVYTAFASTHGLKERASRSITLMAASMGVGGKVTSHMIRAKELKLGGVRMKAPIVGLSTSTAGLFADAKAAGNVGQGFLRRFDLTFDYGNQMIYFEPNKNGERPDRWNLTGLIPDPLDLGRIAEVIPDSPAWEAGIRKGDRILMIDGKPMDRWTLITLRNHFAERVPGDHLSITVKSGNQDRRLSLLLRDLL
ncbi:aspartyl protease family protein [Geothrix terrae]|uniref:aspartyl protease family protein n=1 Tax=Geothrix terrae TaxID=2922720 RepID=UPI001FAD70DF|nr:aspartyl protease family protein [Geothrix terrae]